MTSLAETLSAAGLSSFIGAFVYEGVITVADARLLSESNLKDLGLNMGQRNRLMHQISEQTKAERSTYSEMFDAIDTDNNGEIDLDEFIVALKKLHMYHSDVESRCIFDEGDLDGGGSLDREEFIKMLHRASGVRDSRLAKMTEARTQALHKLKELSGVSIEADDVLHAIVTDEALAEARKYAEPSYWMIPTHNDCKNHRNCELFFNVLSVDKNLSSAMLEKACRVLIDDLEEKLRKNGMSDFVSQNVSLQAVMSDALRIFYTIIHRYSHLTTKGKSYLKTTDGMAYIHSFRKAAFLHAADESVKEVRQVASEHLERRTRWEHQKANEVHQVTSDHLERRSRRARSDMVVKSIRNNLLAGAASAIGSELCSLVEGAVVSGCCIM